ncbi:FHA domain-containing protein [Amnibacterium kyonggiense]
MHVSPEDHETITAALGVEVAEADLAEFYRAHASRGNWLVSAEPQVRIVRDISLRPRQVFVRTTARAGVSAPPVAAPAPPFAAPAPRRSALAEQQDAPTDVLPPDLLAAGIDPDSTTTAVYPAGLLLGDLVVVHGTDVRTVTPTDGVLRIGRGAHNDLVLERPGIVRDHLVLEARDDGWWAVPGATQGGTKLDGVVLDGPAPVRGTAVLELGRGVRVRLSVGPA